jgi:hypothetical protein
LWLIKVWFSASTFVVKIATFAKPENVMGNGRTTVQRQTFVLKMKDKMPTLRKIKRAASRHTSQRFCSTFNFAHPHPKPTHHPTSGQVTI